MSHSDTCSDGILRGRELWWKYPTFLEPGFSAGTADRQPLSQHTTKHSSLQGVESCRCKRRLPPQATSSPWRQVCSMDSNCGVLSAQPGRISLAEVLQGGGEQVLSWDWEVCHLLSTNGNNNTCNLSHTVLGSSRTQSSVLIQISKESNTSSMGEGSRKDCPEQGPGCTEG